MHVHNTVDGYCDGAANYCKELNHYLLNNMVWMMREIEENYEDEYWQQVNLTLSQLKGMVDGYDGTLNRNLSPQDIVVHPI